MRGKLLAGFALIFALAGAIYAGSGYSSGGLVPHGHSSPQDGGTITSWARTITFSKGVNTSTIAVTGASDFGGASTFTATVVVKSSVTTGFTVVTSTRTGGVYMNGWTLVASTAPSASASTGAGYGIQGLTAGKSYWLRVRGFFSADSTVLMRFNGDVAANKYGYGGMTHNNAGTSAVSNGGTATACFLSDPNATRVESNEEFEGDFYFSIAGADNTKASGRYASAYFNSAGQWEHTLAHCRYTGAANVASIQVIGSAGNFTGRISLYEENPAQ